MTPKEIIELAYPGHKVENLTIYIPDADAALVPQVRRLMRSAAAKAEYGWLWRNMVAFSLLWNDKWALVLVACLNENGFPMATKRTMAFVSSKPELTARSYLEFQKTELQMVGGMVTNPKDAN